MSAATSFPSESTGKAMLWTGRVVGGLPALFMLMDGIMKLIKPDFVVEKTTELGFPESVIVGLGIVVLASTLLYLFPRTSVLGAILLTGYLGGAVASHLAHRDGTFAVTFPVVFSILFWGGLWMRDARLRMLTPWRQ